MQILENYVDLHHCILLDVLYSMIVLGVCHCFVFCFCFYFFSGRNQVAVGIVPIGFKVKAQKVPYQSFLLQLPIARNRGEFMEQELGHLIFNDI